MGISQSFYILKKDGEENLKNTLLGTLLYKLEKSLTVDDWEAEDYIEEIRSVLGLRAEYSSDSYGWFIEPEFYETVNFGKSIFLYEAIKEELGIDGDLEHGKYYELTEENLRAIYSELEELYANTIDDYIEFNLNFVLRELAEFLDTVDLEGEDNYYLYRFL